MEPDIISNLPAPIVDKILSHLPIRDAVRTSALTTSWRNKWAFLPSLVFDERTLPRNEEANFATELANAIDHVLLLHLGPIQKFKLSCWTLLPEHNIDRWILYLSRSSIKEFILEYAYTDFYDIPSCLFSCQSLTLLKLGNCSLTLPSSFKGFVNLKSLSFEYVILSKVGYEKLITSCPVLERLTLRMPSSVQSLNVDAPYLQSFELYGDISDVTLQNTPCLAVASIHLCDFKSPMNLITSFASLAKLRRLELGQTFMDCLCIGEKPTEMPKLGANIQHFSTVVDFNYLDETLAVLDLLRGISDLQELNIVSGYSVVHEERDDFWEAVNQNCSFTKLRRMKISKIVGTQFEIDFIGYMLLRSPALESMIVAIADDCSDKWALMKNLLGLRRASALAQITLLDS